MMGANKPSEAAVRVARGEIVAEVHDHLHFNVSAYGKAWTGEGEDTSFIVAKSADKALAAAHDPANFKDPREVSVNLGAVLDAVQDWPVLWDDLLRRFGGDRG